MKVSFSVCGGFARKYWLIDPSCSHAVFRNEIALPTLAEPVILGQRNDASSALRIFENDLPRLWRVHIRL